MRLGGGVVVDRELVDRSGTVRVRDLGTKYEVSGYAPGRRVPHSPVVTTYPLELITRIFEVYGAAHTCDEISRDTDDAEASLDVRLSVESYFPDNVFGEPLRILDFGCGAGSSTMALARLFPHASITGIDLEQEHIDIARMRSAHLGLDARFMLAATMSATDLGRPFDFVFLNAVYEHLLPKERPEVMSRVCRVLRPHGYIVINQTPHRWFPIETHTTGMPLINYLPDRVVRLLVHSWSERKEKGENWEQLLRAGIRGATPNEVLSNVRLVDPSAKLLTPIRVARHQAGIWYAAKRVRIGKLRNRPLRAAIVVADTLGLPAPYITLVIQRSARNIV